MSQSKRAAAQLCRAASTLLQSRGMAKAVTTKLNVELLKTVEGMGVKGKVVRVNHGYARNFLVPNRLGTVIPLPRRGPAITGSSDAAAAVPSAAQQQEAAAAATPAQQTLEKQQRQFDKLMKTLTGSPLTLKRRTVDGDGQTLEQSVAAQDIADAVAKQLRIRVAPEMLDLGGETLRVVGEYRLPLKLTLPSGERAQMEVTIAST